MLFIDDRFSGRLVDREEYAGRVAPTFHDRSNGPPIPELNTPTPISCKPLILPDY